MKNILWTRHSALIMFASAAIMIAGCEGGGGGSQEDDDKEKKGKNTDAGSDLDADADMDAGDDSGGDSDSDTDSDSDSDSDSDADAGTDAAGPTDAVHCSNDTDCPDGYICPRLMGEREIDSLCYRDCSQNENVCEADEICMTTNANPDAGIESKSICLKDGQVQVNTFKACHDMLTAATSCNSNQVNVQFADINQTITMGVAQLDTDEAPGMAILQFLGLNGLNAFTLALTTEDALVVDGAQIDSDNELLSAQMMEVRDPTGTKRAFIWGMSTHAILNITKREQGLLAKAVTGSFSLDMVQYWAEIDISDIEVDAGTN